jgi:hypothetical protein
MDFFKNVVACGKVIGSQSVNSVNFPLGRFTLRYNVALRCHPERLQLL